MLDLFDRSMGCKNGELWGKNMRFTIVDTSVLDGKVVEVRSLTEESEKMKMDLEEWRERGELMSLLRRALELTAPTTKRGREETKANQESPPPENIMLPLRHHSPEEEGIEHPRGNTLLIDLNLPPPANYEDDDGVQETDMQG